MSTYSFKIMTPDKTLYSENVTSVTVSGAGGRLTVLAHHTPMVALLAKGPILIRTPSETLEGEMSAGLLEVRENEAVALVHAFRQIGDNYDEDEALRQARADELMI